MRKTYLITAILLLSSVWAVAQTTPSSQQPVTPGASSPSSTSPSQTSPSQSTVPDSSSTTQTTTTQTTQTSNDSSTAIEGCLSGSAGNWTLTDQSGKAWQLAGDTSKLSDHVGHQVRIMGSDASAGAGASPSSGAGSSAASSGAGASSGPATFTVKKIKMISSSCSTSK